MELHTATVARDREAAHHARYRTAERFFEIEAHADEMKNAHRKALGVRLGPRRMSVVGELGADRLEEDAVVNDRDLSVEAAVWVGIAFGRRAMRRLAGVADANARAARVPVQLAKLRFQARYAFRGAHDLDPAVVNQRHPSAVVSLYSRRRSR